MGRGRLIVIEGLDRSGKSTQCELLISALPNATLIKFPDRTTRIGRTIDAYLTSSSSSSPAPAPAPSSANPASATRTDPDTNLDDRVIHLLFSANRWELKDRMETLLRAGTDVVCDRYIHSGAAYSVAKGVQGMDLPWCTAPDRGLLRPDLLLFLDVREGVAASRAGYGAERYERVELQRRVRDVFCEMLDGVAYARVLDADDTVPGLHARIVRAVADIGDATSAELQYVT